MIRVIVRFPIAPGKLQAFLDATKELIEETRKEDGCIDYSLAQSPGDENSLVLIEHWRDQASLDAHCKTPHFTAAVPRLGDFCSCPPVPEIYSQIV